MTNGLRYGVVAGLVGVAAEIVEERSKDGVLGLLLVLPLGLLLVGSSRDPSRFLWTWTTGQVMLGVLGALVFLPLLYFSSPRPYLQTGIIFGVSAVGFALFSLLITSKWFDGIAKRGQPVNHDIPGCVQCFFS